MELTSWRQFQWTTRSSRKLLHFSHLHALWPKLLTNFTLQNIFFFVQMEDHVLCVLQDVITWNYPHTLEDVKPSTLWSRVTLLVVNTQHFKVSSFFLCG